MAKPSGPTSHDVVGLVRRLSPTRRVGHGGTLDPFAAGVLPVFLGRATRLVEYHLGATKRYRATICFGESSTTDDIDGERTPIDGPPVTREAVEAAMLALTGPIRQVPPDYSAVQIEGRRAYQLARAGEPVELAPRDVVDPRARRSSSGTTATRRARSPSSTSTCSAGTYIRALARDLGDAASAAARTSARWCGRPRAAFRLEDAVAFERSATAAARRPGGLRALLRPIDAGLEDLPARRDHRRRDPAARGGPASPARRRRSRSATPTLVLAVGPDGRVAAVCRAVGGAAPPAEGARRRGPRVDGRPVSTRPAGAGPAPA